MPHLRPRELIRSVLFLTLLLVGAGCTGRDLLLNTVGAVSEAALEERGLGEAYRDARIRLAVSEAWFRASIDLFSHLSVLSSRGDVVLIGRVAREADRLEAARLAERAAGARLRRLRNVLTVGPALSLSTVAQDHLISNRLDVALTLDPVVSALNYQNVVCDGVVYLVGEARNGEEFERVHATAALIPGVTRVESYVHPPGIRLLPEPIHTPGEAQTPPPYKRPAPSDSPSARGGILRPAVRPSSPAG